MTDEKTSADFDINTLTYGLMQEEPFFAALSRRVDKRKDMSIPTAGIRINPTTGFYELIYNPEFMASLPNAHKTGVLVHEFYHMALMHVSSRLPDELAGVMADPRPSQEKRALFQIWNIAADLSINYLIGEERLPEMCCFPGKKPFDDPAFKPGQSAEYYYRVLREKKDEFEKQLQEGAGQFDDHSAWGASGDGGEGGVGGNIPDDIREMAEEKLKGSIRSAIQETSADSRGWGTVSADMRKMIAESVTSVVNWRTILRNFVKKSNRSDKSSTMKRLNRRYPYVHPGRKIKREANIAIAIDQSGSVSNQMLVTFFSELNGLSKLAKFTVVPFDTKVQEDHVFEWEKGQRVQAERVSCGGTCFNAPTRWVNERKFDGLIVLTDMEAPKPIPCKTQRLWMTTPEYAARPYFNPHPEMMIEVK